MYECVCVCACAHMCVCVCVCMYAHTCVFMYVCVFCLCACLYVCLHTYTPVHVCVQFVAHKVQLIVKSCCVSLVNYSKKILQMSVSHLITTWENRPGAQAFRYQSTFIYELQCISNNKFIKAESLRSKL